MKGYERGLIEVIFLECLNKHTKIEVRLVGVPTWFQTEHLPNAIVEPYCRQISIE
jgi:hypothetical protein